MKGPVAANPLRLSVAIPQTDRKKPRAAQLVVTKILIIFTVDHELAGGGAARGRRISKIQRHGGRV